MARGKKETSIEPTEDGPYHVRNLGDLRDARENRLQCREEMLLCRCGGSGSKPYCDGTHLKNDFSGAKEPGRLPDKVDIYQGRDITIYDNRCVCAHAGFCTDNSPAVFDASREPWIEPDAEPAKKTAATIKLCPSGALSCKEDGVVQAHRQREPSVKVSRNGPLYVTGEIRLVDECQPESLEHYTLCRCGASKNKPFCDGSHWKTGFMDESSETEETPRRSSKGKRRRPESRPK